MMTRLIALAGALAAAGSPLAAQTPAAPAATVAVPTTAPATDPFAVQFDLSSKITGRTYRILLHRPTSAAPKGAGLSSTCSTAGAPSARPRRKSICAP